MQDYNDRRPQSCATFLAAKIEGFYKGWNCSSLIRPNIFSESYSSAGGAQMGKLRDNYQVCFVKEFKNVVY